MSLKNQNFEKRFLHAREDKKIVPHRKTILEKNGNRSVVTLLLEEIIPRFGVTAH